MNHSKIIDKWADDFEVAFKVPNAECLISLLVSLSLVDFIRSDVNEEFITYVSRKFSPDLKAEYFEITKEAVYKQILSLDNLLAQGRTSITMEHSPIDYDLLRDLEFDISRLGIK